MLNVNIKESDWPEWAVCAAQDANGRVVFYEIEPTNDCQPNEWATNGKYTLYKKGEPNPNWKQAIMKRPQTQVAENEPERKHNHYYKDVRHLDFIDVYRVMELYEVADPCLQHAGKKILVSGKRGIKDQRKDVQEAIDTLQRWIEMQNENERQEER